MSFRIWNSALGKGLASLGIITQKGHLTLAINERFLLGKSKKWVDSSMYWMTSLVENDNWEEIVGRCHAHGGTKFSIGLCIPGKYMNQGKLSGSSFHQKSLPYRPNHFSLTIYSRSHGLRPWVTKIIYDFARFLMSFLAGNMNIHHGFPYVSQGLFLKASKGHIKVLGPWCSSCYKSSSLAKILTACPLAWPSLGPLFFFFLLLLLFLSFSFFLGFSAFMVLLNFMNWAFFC